MSVRVCSFYGNEKAVGCAEFGVVGDAADGDVAWVEGGCEVDVGIGEDLVKVHSCIFLDF